MATILVKFGNGCFVPTEYLPLNDIHSRVDLDAKILTLALAILEKQLSNPAHDALFDMWKTRLAAGDKFVCVRVGKAVTTDEQVTELKEEFIRVDVVFAILRTPTEADCRKDRIEALRREHAANEEKIAELAAKQTAIKTELASLETIQRWSDEGSGGGGGGGGSA